MHALAVTLMIFISSHSSAKECKEPSTRQMARAICASSQPQGQIRSPQDWIRACGTGGESTTQKVETVSSSTWSFIKQMGQTVLHPIDSTTRAMNNVRTYAPAGARHVAGNVRQGLSRIAQLDAQKAAGAVSASSRAVYNKVVEDTRSVLLATSTFHCAPPALQQQMLCQFIGETATGYIEGAAPLAGAARAARITAKAKQLDARAESSGDAATVATARAKLAKTAKETVIQKDSDGTAIIESVSQTGRKKLYLEEVVVHRGKRVKERSEIVRDSKSLAIDSNFEAGAKFAQLSAHANKDGHLVSFDLNYLGKVNYFPGGTSTGNAYIKRVSEIIRGEVRNADTTLFKNGGDELVLVLPSKDPREVQRISQRVADKIFNDPQLNKMFREARTSRAAQVPRGVKPTSDQLTPLQSISNLRPSVSVGATRIRQAKSAEDTWDQALQRADAAGARYKNDVRNLHGTYDGKQGLAASTSTARPNPRVLPPMPLPE